MFQKKSIQQVMDVLREPDVSKQIVHWKTIEPRESVSVPLPASLHTNIQSALNKRGISSLYIHQLSAFETAQRSENFVAVTPTASGKTLCYNLPVLQEVANNPESRALYLFPTKALAQDQKAEMNELIDEMGLDIKSYTYDGDTPRTYDKW